MHTTTNLSDFGYRELRLAAELLTAYCDAQPDYLGDGFHVMMNRYSGYVFLTDEDYTVAMINGDTLEQFHSYPNCGAEDYRHYLEGLDLTETQKDELIHIMAGFAQSFADYVFGNHPLQQRTANTSPEDSQNTNDTLSLWDTLNTAANDNEPTQKEGKNAA